MRLFLLFPIAFLLFFFLFFLYGFVLSCSHCRPLRFASSLATFDRISLFFSPYFLFLSFFLVIFFCYSFSRLFLSFFFFIFFPLSISLSSFYKRIMKVEHVLLSKVLIQKFTTFFPVGESRLLCYIPRVLCQKPKRVASKATTAYVISMTGRKQDGPTKGDTHG